MYRRMATPTVVMPMSSRSAVRVASLAHDWTTNVIAAQMGKVMCRTLHLRALLGSSERRVSQTKMKVRATVNWIWTPVIAEKETSRCHAD